MTAICKTERPIAPLAIPSVGDALRNLGQTLHLWQARASLRNHLMELDDHLLDDIGLARFAAVREAAKPFWRA